MLSFQSHSSTTPCGKLALLKGQFQSIIGCFFLIVIFSFLTPSFIYNNKTKTSGHRVFVSARSAVGARPIPDLYLYPSITSFLSTGWEWGLSSHAICFFSLKTSCNLCKKFVVFRAMIQRLGIHLLPDKVHDHL